MKNLRWTYKQKMSADHKLINLSYKSYIRNIVSIAQKLGKLSLWQLDETHSYLCFTERTKAEWRRKGKHWKCFLNLKLKLIFFLFLILMIVSAELPVVTVEIIWSSVQVSFFFPMKKEGIA